MAGSDYSRSMNNFTTTTSTNWSEHCLNVGIIDNDGFDGDKTFAVILTTSDPNLLGNDLAMITIIDDDGEQC